MGLGFTEKVLLTAVTERQRKMENTPFTAPGACDIWDWVGPKAGARNSTKVSHTGSRNPRLGPQPLPSRVCVNRVLDQELRLGTDPRHSDVGLRAS